MLERIRANVAAGNAYDTRDGTPDPRLEPACERRDGHCGPPVMASHDLARWLDAIVRNLPGGTGSVDVDVVPTGAALHRYAISVGWNQSGEPDRAHCTIVVDL
jgi:hypothetical protein